MQPARIAELLTPFLDDASQRLTADDLERISTYIDILLRWNARMNLTAIRDPEEIVTRHFGESLFAASVLYPQRNYVGTAAIGCPAEQSSAEPPAQIDNDSSGKWPQPLRGLSERAALQGRVEGEKINGALATTSTLADIGSGAGFPGIPIKLWRPDLSLTLIESNHKKATFLREVARALTLTDINILTMRAETLGDAFQTVTLRAVERFASILPVAAKLVAPGGRLALLIGSHQLIPTRLALTEVSGFEPDRLTAMPLPLSHARVLTLVERSV